MKKYKKIFTSLIFILFITISLYLGTNFNNEKTYTEDKPKQIKNENTLSMILEQTAGAGDYEMTTVSTWPTDGYLFNKKLSKCTNVGKVSWDDTKKVVTMSGNTSDKCFVYFDKLPPSKVSDACSSGENLAGCIKTLSDKGDSSNTNIYYHDLNLTNGAGDNSYRYAGASSSVNNYVCFGSTDATCPTDNLYRIIGVFGDQVKLIKSTVATSALLGTNGDYYSDTKYYWNYKNNTSINDGYGSNTWSTSLLNKTNLNINYINNIGSEWASKIAQTTWKVGGNTTSLIRDVVAATAYQNEVGSSSRSTTYNAKIGLMYVSDYGFAADPAAWTKTLYNYDGSVKSLNWLYLGSYEWTISRNADDSFFVFYVYSGGLVYDGTAGESTAVRPVFYLDKSITYTSGLGTSTDPFRIN